MGFETVPNVSLSNSRCKRRTIRKRLKGQKRKGGKLLVNFVKLARIAISPVLGNLLQSTGRDDLVPAEGWSDRSQNCLHDMRIVGNTELIWNG